jgi:hypothetical protein
LFDFYLFAKSLFFSQHVPGPMLGVGVETWPFMDESFDERIELMQQLGLRELDIWKAPIPNDWLRSVAAFVNDDACTGAIGQMLKKKSK